IIHPCAPHPSHHSVPTRRASDLVTTTGAMVGTLAYMSPEQLHNAKEVDYRTDLWSLAVVAYRAVTGQLPFPDEDGIGALLLAVRSEERRVGTDGKARWPTPSG